MTQYKEYHAVYTSGSVTTKMLRETKNYFIDSVGTKYKKGERKHGVIASNVKYSNWLSIGWDIYELNHEYVLQKIKEHAQYKFTMSIANILRQKSDRLTYDEAVKINEVLGLGVEQ